MRTHQSDLELEQRVWQRVGGSEDNCLQPLLRQADAEWAGLRQLNRSFGQKTQKLAAAADANRLTLRGMIIMEGGNFESGHPAVPTATGLLASLCRGSLALCQEYEARCQKSPAFRALYSREQEIFTELLEMLGSEMGR